MAYPGYTYPQFLYSTPYVWPYFQQPMITPLVPTTALPPSPHGGAGTRRVHFDDEPYMHTYGRQRPPSWHAGMAGSAAPPNPAPFPSPPMVYAPLPPMAGPPPGYTHHRRVSDSAIPQATFMYPPWVLYSPPSAPPPPQLHPLLNGESQRPLLLFDTSLHTFSPTRIFELGRTSGSPLSQDELAEPATHPGITRMKIICDDIPQWPMTLEAREQQHHSAYLHIPYTPSRTTNAPITLGDVLAVIHRVLQTQVSHREWAKVTRDQETSIARAYTRRCRTFPSAEQFEASQGVRRVDYLLDRFMFGGLVRERGEHGFENLRLIMDRKR